MRAASFKRLLGCDGTTTKDAGQSPRPRRRKCSPDSLRTPLGLASCSSTVRGVLGRHTPSPENSADSLVSPSSKRTGGPRAPCVPAPERAGRRERRPRPESAPQSCKAWSPHERKIESDAQTDLAQNVALSQPLVCARGLGKRELGRDRNL